MPEHMLPLEPLLHGEGSSPACGEHTEDVKEAITEHGSSPYRRGGSRVREFERRELRIIPAIREEHALLRGYANRITRSSPRMRGARRHDVVQARQRGIIPAYAGSTPPWRRSVSSRADHPRVRGEHSSDRPDEPAPRGSSPRTWGAPIGFPHGRADHRIIPAYAGSMPALSPAIPSSTDHPRVRGEHRMNTIEKTGIEGSSPHTRGARMLDQDGHLEVGIIPAYAGSTSWLSWRSVQPRDHPRIRGEHPGLTEKTRYSYGSSPHTRGTRNRRSALQRAVGIIPAYAGNTHPLAPWRNREQDHPRIRGEHRPTSGLQVVSTGSSPHTRGTPHPRAEAQLLDGIIPAYAGNTEGRHLRGRDVQDHPRIRGEHQIQVRGRPAYLGSSPHTRGTRDRVGRDGLRHRIIPAYAGNTSTRTCSSSQRTDHPSIRGEHSARVGVTTRNVGSSPHTRGTPDRGRRAAAQERIIPAYAGNTPRRAAPGGR